MIRRLLARQRTTPIGKRLDIYRISQLEGRNDENAFK